MSERNIPIEVLFEKTLQKLQKLMSRPTRTKERSLRAREGERIEVPEISLSLFKWTAKQVFSAVQAALFFASFDDFSSFSILDQETHASD